MRIELYTAIYNEEKILPYFLVHYSFVDKMRFYDSRSTDKTREILKDRRVKQTKLINFNNEKLTVIRNKVWRRSRADYVIYVDCDEFIYHPEGIRNYITGHPADVYITEGYEMVSEQWPENLFEVKTGVRSAWYDKPVIFRPNLKITFEEGGHDFNPKEGIKIDRGLKLIHYNYLGVDNVLKKRKERMRNGSQEPIISEYEIRERHKCLLENAKIIL